MNTLFTVVVAYWNTFNGESADKTFDVIGIDNAKHICKQFRNALNSKRVVAWDALTGELVYEWEFPTLKNL